MAVKTRIFLTVIFAISLGYKAHGWMWDWQWSENKPSSCPSQNEETHICSSLSSANATCISIRCCTEYDTTDDEYNDGMEANSQTWEPDTGGRHRHGGCRLCVSYRSCTAYKCRRYCCDGYTLDWDGRCVNETSRIDCQNGGTPYEYFGMWTCLCPLNFTGEHCETPKCHCQNGGQCRPGWYDRPDCTYCECKPGFTGVNCSQPVCQIQCRNGGSCVKDGDAESCLCPTNYVGKFCEDYHVNDEKCAVPDMWWSPPDCFDECNGYTDCPGTKLCCKEGCSRVCRYPKDETCQFEGRTYSVGAKVSRDDPCLNCTCTASGDVVCSTVTCAACQGTTLYDPSGNQCCPVCKDDPSRRPPLFENCPSQPVNVTVDWGSNKASLQQLENRLRATDYHGQQISVSVSPSSIAHCACLRANEIYHEVVAKAVDRYGSSAECKFKVYVIDREPPRITSCPDDIYVFEDEVVTWEEPHYSDNVGVYYKTYTNNNKGSTYPSGVYKVTFRIVDYEYNSAVCDFRINSTRRGTNYEDMAQGMRQRAVDKHIDAVVIVAPIVGLLIVVISLLLVFFLCRRRRLAGHNRRHGRRPPSARGHNYDNNIYAICGPPSSFKDGMKLPQYTLPTNPPAYSSDMTEGEYAYVAPPSYKEVEDLKKNVYDNPGYETVTQTTVTNDNASQDHVIYDNKSQKSGRGSQKE